MFQTLETFDTELYADSVEWCPVENFQDVFVCATYQMEPEDKSTPPHTRETEKVERIGSIFLFQVIKDGKLKLKLLQKLIVPAVTDMKWAHKKLFNDKILLGVANADAFLQIYELTTDNEILLKLVSQICVNELQKCTLTLSLDWSTGRMDHSSSTNVRITTSDSEGLVSLFTLNESASDITKIFTCPANYFEAWIAAFDYWNTNIVYTGGDDRKFKQLDIRLETFGGFLCKTNQSHKAGVTSIHCNLKKEFCLVSGW